MKYLTFFLLPIFIGISLEAQGQNLKVELKVVSAWHAAPMGDQSAPPDPEWKTIASFSGGIAKSGTLCLFKDNECNMVAPCPYSSPFPFCCNNTYTFTSGNTVILYDQNPTAYNISTGFTINVELQAFEEDGPSGECHFGGKDDDYSTGTTSFTFPYWNFTTFPAVHDFSVTTESGLFRVDYQVIVHNMDALSQNKLRYANTSGTTQSTFCGGSTVRLYADRHAGYSGGYFQWQTWNGSSWVNSGSYTTNNYYEFTAGTTAPTVRVRSISPCYGCQGSYTSDGYIDNQGVSITFLPAPPPVNNIVSSTTGACSGSNTGSVTITLNSANSANSHRFTLVRLSNGAETGTPLNATIPSGSTSPTYTFTNLAAGSYRVKVTAVNASGQGDCTTQKDGITVNTLGLPVVTGQPTAGQCPGDNGSITATITQNGVANNIFRLYNAAGSTLLNTSPAQSGNSYTFSNLTPGTYTVKATNGNGCESLLSGQVVLGGAPAAITANIAMPTIGGYQIPCIGGTGVLNVTPNGGTPPYTVSLSSGASQNNIAAGSQASFVLGAGVYTITVTDSRNCVNSAFSATLNAPGSTLGVSVSNILPTTDCANVGSATLNGAGGAAPYTYRLGTSGTFVSNNVFNNLSAGTYVASVRDAAGCIQTTTFAITAPSPLIVEALSLVNESCADAFDGEITLQASGGNPPYQYRINNGTLTSNNQFSGLTSDSYTFQVIDAASCTDEVQYGISAPEPIVITNTSIGSFNCEGDATVAVITYTGRSNGINGELVMEISLDNGATWFPEVESYDDGGVSQITLYNLQLGSYQIKIRDASPPACVSAGAASALNVTAPVVLFGMLDNVTDETCAGANDGTISVSWGGGVPPYSVRLYRFVSNEAQFVAEIGPTTSTSYTFTGLSPSVWGGTPGFLDAGYAVAIMDGSDGFSFTCSSGIPAGFGAYPYTFSPIDVLPNTPINGGNAQSTGPLLNCYGNNGVITVTGVSGGEAPYSYSIDGFDFQSSNVFTSVGATTNVFVRDNRGCTVGPQTVTIASAPVTINATATLVAPETACTSGAIQLNISGGTAPYSYVLRADGCTLDFSDGTTTNGGIIPVAGLAAGTYDLCVRDAGGCTDNASVTIPLIDPPIISTVNVQNVTCFNGGNNGSITIQVSSGTAPYTVTLNNGMPQTGVSSFNYNNLAAGTYLIFVTDNKGCTTFQTVTVFSNNNIFASVVETDINGCTGGNNGSIDVTPTAGVAPYSIFWAYDNTTTTGVGEGQTITRSGLSAGAYDILVTDAQGCSRSVLGVIEEPLPIFANLQTINPLCSNVQNGSVTVVAGGGTAPLTYSLNGGTAQGSNIFNNLSAGNYTVTVQDVNGCSNTFMFSLSFQRILTGNATFMQPDCFGGSNGTISVAVTGGGSPYTYSLNGGSFNAINPIPNIAAGTYNVIARDNGGCEIAFNNIQVTQPTPLNAGATLVQDASCALNAGTIQASANGGTPSYTYQWNGNSSLNNPLLTNAPPGLNTVVVTDSKGCMASASVTVSNVPTVSLSLANTTNETCDQMNGAATVSVQGGTSPFNYSWSHNPALNNPTASGLAAGVYTVSVTDGNGCLATLNVTVAENAGPTASVNVQNTVCIEGNGSITLTPTGGLPPYNYVWSHASGLNAPQATGLSSGAYSTTITDANNCTFIINANVGLNPPPAANTIVTPASCQGNNGSIQVTINGGTAPFNYVWSHNAGLNSNIANNLTSGTYSVTVTDNSGCITIATANVSELPPPNVFVNTQTASCSLNNGIALATVAGGTGPYTYTWSSGSPNNPQAQNLGPGNYTLTITDAFGCQDIESFIINNIPGPEGVSTIVQNSVCSNFNGSITVTPQGGTAPFNYNWSHNAFLNAPNATTLPGGVYTITITDANNCQITTTQTVLYQPSPIIQTVEVNNSLCANGNGSIEIAPQGTGPFTYNWTGQVSAGPIAQNLNAGAYTVTVTDANNCVRTQSFTIALEPGPAIQLINQVNDVCGQALGSIRVRGIGGAQPYQFSWSHNPGLNSDQATGLVAGTYTVTITDQNGCAVNGTYTLTEIAGPTLSVVNIGPANCGNPVGSIIVAASGGLAPYTYHWSHDANLNSPTANGLAPGVYIVQITDANNCSNATEAVVPATESPAIGLVSVSNDPCIAQDVSITVAASGGTGTLSYSWSHNASLNSPVANGLPSGNYGVTVTDANGCQGSLNTNVSDQAGPQLQVASATGSTCGFADGSITLAVSSGQAPYSYQWSHNAGLNSLTANNLAAGNYTATVTDANGCTATTSAQVSDTQGPQAVVQNITNAVCTPNSGSIIISVANGTAPFSYSWSHNPGLNAPSAFNLSAGNYTLSITDANGCLAVTSNTIAYIAPPTVTTSATNAVCTPNSGSISVSVSQGTAPYNIQWLNAGLSGFNVSGLFSGSYLGVVTDANGCTTNFNSSVSFVAGPTPIMASQQNATCGQANGVLDVAVIGGQAPYTYHWSHNANLNTFMATNLAAGSYTVTVTDGNNCSATLNATVQNNGGPSLQISAVSSACGQNTGSLTVTPTGGTAPFAYQWSHNNNLNNATAVSLAAGSYTVTVTDFNGCTSEIEGQVSDQNAASVAIANFSNALCTKNNGFIQLNTTGGVGPYSYEWSHDTSLNSPSATGLPAGNYQVTVSDANGCESITSKTLSYIAGPSLSIANTENSTCTDGQGSISVQASSGVLPYSYQWSHNPSLNSPNATNLSAGNYSVTVTDVNGCIADTQASTQLIEGPQAVIDDITDTYCGNNAGAISISASGGSLPYNYAWSHNPALNSNSATGLDADAYSVTVTDANGCVSNIIANVADTPGFTASMVQNQPTTCGNNNGQLQVTVSNGQTPLSYEWSHDPGLNSATASNLPVDVYFVTITDISGCEQTVSAAVQSSDGPVLSIASVTDASCGLDNGSISVSLAGGQAPFNFLWSTGQTLSSISGLAVGAYQVTVTDSNGCTGVAVTTINSGDTPQLQLLSTTETSCNSPSGQIALSAFGGLAPYTFSWSHNPGLNSATATGLAAGDYSITLTDQAGCFAEVQASIEQNTDLAIALQQTQSAICASATGSATVMGQGGQAPYTYSWSHNASLNNATASQLAQGAYEVSVTDAEGCLSSLSVVVNAQNESVGLSIMQNDPSACNTGTGMVILTATGGTAPYTYNWSHSANETDNTAGQLLAGNYTATVTDTNGCTGSINVVVNQTAAPQLLIGNVSETDCNQSTGSIEVSTSGGIAPYSYTWSHSPSENDALATGLGAGNYFVTATDANGCTAVIDATVSDAGAPDVDITTSASYCDQPTGSATVVVISTGSFTYEWENTANPGTILHTDETAENLTEGTYSVTITNQDGCERILLANISDLPDIAVTLATEQISCFGQADGQITASVNAGGTAPYTYQWSNNDQGASISGLSTGIYSVTVSDANGCVSIQNTTISQPAELTLSLSSIVQPDCGASANGSVSVQASGGVGPYAYLWNTNQNTSALLSVTAGAYSVTVSDANGCTAELQVDLNPIGNLNIAVSINDPSCTGANDGSASVTANGAGPFNYQWDLPGNPVGNSVSNLAPGTYQVTVSNQSGCSSSQQFIIEEASVLTLNLSATPSCLNELNGTTTAQAGGGAGGFQYLWGGGQQSASLSNLLPGLYSVTATDANGCAVSDEVIVDGVGFPSLVIESITQPDCVANPGGTVSVSANGGAGIIAYSWNDPAQQNTATASNLAPGNYQVLATDQNGCSSLLDVQILQPAGLNANIGAFESPSCFGLSDASATVLVQNPSGSYSYEWNDPAGQTTATANNLAAGNYSVIVTREADGCSTTVSVSIPETPQLVVIEQTLSSPLCFGQSNGTAEVAASGGTGPYNYLWNDPATQASPLAINLAAGNYSVTATDDNGCAAVLDLIIEDPSILEATINEFNAPLCAGQNSGNATVAATGGTGSYLFQWDDLSAQTTAQAVNLATGVYHATVTDSNGCQSTTQVNIPQTPPIVLTTSEQNDPSCTGLSDGQITVAASGGTGTLVFAWSNGSGNTTQVSGLPAGDYTVSVTDANGCLVSETYSLTDAIALTIGSSTTTQPVCYNGTDGSATVVVQGGAGPYDYLWDDANAQTSATATNLSVGNYTVSITDANGCTLIHPVSVTSQAQQIVLNGSLVQPSCTGASNGQITINAQGGAGNFVYYWQGGSSGSTLSELAAGIYAVTATDAQGCSQSGSFEILEGQVFEIDLGSRDTSLCFGEVLFVDYSSQGYAVNWTSVAGFSSNNPLTFLENSDTYFVEVTNQAGCVARDTITIVAAPSPFQAFFVVATDVVVNEEVRVVEASWPIPSEINWYYDTDQVEFIRQEDDQYFFRFTQTGNISLTMQGLSGNCDDWLTKIITVHADSTTIPSINPQQPDILSFNLSPNPNSGFFRANVGLSAPLDVILSVFDINGLLKDRRVLSGNSSYLAEYSLALQPGVHLMVVQTPRQRKTIVFTVVTP